MRKTIMVPVEIEEFCPEDCMAMNPVKVPGGKIHCLNLIQCMNLRKILEAEQKRKEVPHTHG